MSDTFSLEESTLKSDRVFDGLLLKVFRDTVALPDGKEATREWIDHPGAAATGMARQPDRDHGL